MRPLGKLIVERKIAATGLLQLNKGTIDVAFDNLQLGLKKLGTEIIAHQFQVIGEVDPEIHRFFPDGINAFNNISREHAFAGIAEHCPELLPFVLLNYGGTSHTWAMDEFDDTFSLEMREGAQQGCTLGSLLCGFATLHMVMELRDMTTVRGKALFFCDDGNIAAPHENMLACMRYLKNEGPKYGYMMHMTEGTCLMGRCGSMSIALRRRQDILEIGFHPSMIKIHPDDMLVNDIQDDDTINEVLLQDYH